MTLLCVRQLYPLPDLAHLPAASCGGSCHPTPLACTSGLILRLLPAGLPISLPNPPTPRHWLKGPRAGTTEVLIDRLPGFPDGVSRAPDGGWGWGRQRGGRKGGVVDRWPKGARAAEGKDRGKGQVGSGAGPAGRSTARLSM